MRRCTNLACRTRKVEFAVSKYLAAHRRRYMTPFSDPTPAFVDRFWNLQACLLENTNHPSLIPTLIPFDTKISASGNAEGQLYLTAVDRSAWSHSAFAYALQIQGTWS